MLDSVIDLFNDESFRHWFFWTSVTLVILGGTPTFVKIRNVKN